MLPMGNQARAPSRSPALTAALPDGSYRSVLVSPEISGKQ